MDGFHADLIDLQQQAKQTSYPDQMVKVMAGFTSPCCEFHAGKLVHVSSFTCLGRLLRQGVASPAHV